MKKFSYLVLFVFFAHTVMAQSYNTALGLRLGTEWGATIQQRIAKKITVEGILQSSIQRNEATLTALLEQHNPIITKRFNVYYGAGIHKGWVTGADRTYENPFGITGIIGGEFTIARFNISYDFKPSFNLSGGEKKLYSHTGVSVRYVIIKKQNDFFNKNKKKKKKNKGGGINWKFWE